LTSEVHYTTPADADAAVNPVSSLAVTYDQNGNPIQTVDGDDHTVVRTFDGDNRLLTETHYASEADATAGTNPVSSLAYTYDQNGNVTQVVDGEQHRVELTYDGDNRLTSQTDFDQFGTEVSSVNYTYDQAGDVVEMEDGDQHVSVMTYD